MKKLLLTAALILGLVMASFAQGQQDRGLFHSEGGGFFRRGTIYGKGMRDGGTFSLCLPGHNNLDHWNGGSQGHDDDLVPLGGGALLLVGFGAAYALTKRNKKR